MSKNIYILITISIPLSLLLSSYAFGQTYQIKQDNYTYSMPVTQTVTTETFVIVSTGEKSKKYIKKDSVFNIYSDDKHDEFQDNSSTDNLTICFPTAYFQLGSPTLVPAEADSVLSTVARFGISPRDPLIVTGHTCSLGTERRNRTLSLQRAEAVAEVLRNHGYTVAAVQGRASENPATCDPKYFYKNRRVEVEQCCPKQHISNQTKGVQP